MLWRPPLAASQFGEDKLWEIKAATLVGGHGMPICCISEEPKLHGVQNILAQEGLGAGTRGHPGKGLEAGYMWPEPKFPLQRALEN